MPRCKLSATFFHNAAKISRDAKTPEEQTKQILQIAAILPGQTPKRRFSIPSRSNSLERVPTRQKAPEVLETQHETHEATHHEQAPQTSQQDLSQQASQHELTPQSSRISAQGLPVRQKPQYPQAFGDVIDSSNTSQQAIPTGPTAPTSAPTSNPILSQPVRNDENKAQPATSTDSVHKYADELPPSRLLNSVKGQPSKGNALRRWDSETHSEDEFHDAIS
jgi:hypothetical protein